MVIKSNYVSGCNEAFKFGFAFEIFGKLKSKVDSTASLSFDLGYFPVSPSTMIFFRICWETSDFLTLIPQDETVNAIVGSPIPIST